MWGDAGKGGEHWLRDISIRIAASSQSCGSWTGISAEQVSSVSPLLATFSLRQYFSCDWFWMCCEREEEKEGFYEAWRWWQSMLDKWQSDNETAGQWLKRGHESQERGQDGVCLFTMHKHKVRSDFSYLSFQMCYFLMLWSLVLSNSMAPDV